MRYNNRFLRNLVAVCFIAIFTSIVAVGTAKAGNLKIEGGSPGIITSVPRTMTYQGILKDSEGNPINEDLPVVFKIYSIDSGDIPLWEEIQDVEFVDGYFTVELGTANPLNLPFDEDYWLELVVGGDILSPRQKLNMSAYSARTDTSDYAFSGGGWVDDGTVVRLENSNDYVGIGTASPTNKVHIVGSDSAPLLNVEKIGPGRGVRVSTSSACALWVENSGNHGLRVTNANGDGIHVENAGNWAGYFNGTGYFRDNVGIGALNPQEKLELAGNLRFTEEDLTRSIYVEKSDGINEPGHDLEIYAGEYSDAGGLETKDGGDLILHGGKGYGFAGGDVYIYGGGSDITFSPIGDVIIAHNGDASGGDVGIGVDAPTEKLDVEGTIRLRGISFTMSDLANVVVDNNGVLWKESVPVGGTKENVKNLEINPQKVLSLQPVKFNWQKTGDEDVGLVAEDVEKTFPELVSHDNNGKPAFVKYDKLVLYLLELTKAQQQQISLLESRIVELENNIR